jgi:hypothetical protein
MLLGIEQKLSKDNCQDKILSEASSWWIKYQSSPRIGISVGVDSSWNKRSYQGFDLYVVDAIAVTSDNTILEWRWNDDKDNIREGVENLEIFYK